MTELSVTLSKLRKYCKNNGSFDLEIKSGKVTLSFVPSFPEAQEKGIKDSSPPRISMFGSLVGNKVIFDKVEIEDSNGTIEKPILDAQLTYEGWLAFIEDNF